MRLKQLTREFPILALFFLLPLILFWNQTIGGKTLIPTENIYQFEPYATYQEVVRAPTVPHNHLLDDLILQNYQWKAFIRENIANGEIPLWNPYQFSGTPFMAAGQQSTLYPLSILYYLLPLTAAYGWFTVVNLWLAGWFMSLLMRCLGIGKFGAIVSGVTYQLCGFFIASAVHPMILGAVVWLPLIVLMVELIIREHPFLGRKAFTPWIIIGALAIAFNVFAGHPELTIYTLLIAGYFAAGRLLWEIWRSKRDTQQSIWQTIHHWAGHACALLLMVALGIGLAAVQFIPLFEFANSNWRAERGDLQTVLSYAHPMRDLVQYFMPNFYGNPAHHHYVDWFSMRRVPVDFINALGEQRYHTEWGIKNYVEGALYVGILPLMLAIFALIATPIRNTQKAASYIPYRWLFAGLVLISLTFMFGLPTYAIIYVLPGINQLNTAFRWVYGVTFGIAVLAGFGAYTLTVVDMRIHKWARRFSWGSVGLGSLILLGLLLSRVFYHQLEPLIARVFNGMAQANLGFADARMFYNYQATNVLIFGMILLGTGGVFFIFSKRALINTDTSNHHSSRFKGQVFAVVLISLDLMIASWGFNPASDPALLDFTPPAIQWLLDRQAEGEQFRYITLEAPARGLDNMLKANVTMRYGLNDVRGYDSIISADYVAFMRQVQIQPQLDFNRVAPLYEDRLQEINWDLLRLLNVRYIVTHPEVQFPESLTTSSDPARFPPQIELAFCDPDGAACIYRLRGGLPAQLIEVQPADAPLEADFITATGNIDGLRMTTLSTRERAVEVDLTGVATQWLVISEAYAPGWRAFVRPVGVNADGEPAQERELDVVQAFGILQAIRLNPADLNALYDDIRESLSTEQQTALANGQYIIRLIYSPTSFQVGAFGTAISAALLMFIGGVWLWGVFVGTSTSESSSVSRVARNSIAPIILNLFNRGIDFAFAFVMLRILGPEDAGIYYYAIVVFVWFDIFTNFGLDVFLIREASREREQAGYYFLNTTYLRLFLMVACIPLLLGFLLVRQSTIEPQLNQEALLAIGLLYIGLAPGSISKGLTSLFYAFEKAEYPAAVTTITTINKAVFGLMALLLGYGIVGLAAVSIGINFVTLGILLWAGRGLMRGLNQHPTRPNHTLIGSMVSQSWALMLNHFLATIFFQIDIVILEAIRGAKIVGQYSVAYRWLLAINIIPAFFTQALLPVMSRQARDDRAALKRTYSLGIKILFSIAVPLAVMFTFLAEALTLLLGGEAFMPAGAIALQIMIWSIPIGWMNSLTQYALIAVDLQRQITRAFFVAVTFNITTNLIFIPQFGYQAAAVTTIFSELVLLIPFGILMQGALGKLDWRDMTWRAIVSGAVMAAVMLVGWGILPLMAILLAPIVYVGMFLVLQPFNDAEKAVLMPILPGRLRQLMR